MNITIGYFLELDCAFREVLFQPFEQLWCRYGWPYGPKDFTTFYWKLIEYSYSTIAFPFWPYFQQFVRDLLSFPEAVHTRSLMTDLRSIFSTRFAISISVAEYVAYICVFVLSSSWWSFDRFCRDARSEQHSDWKRQELNGITFISAAFWFCFGFVCTPASNEHIRRLNKTAAFFATQTPVSLLTVRSLYSYC